MVSASARPGCTGPADRTKASSVRAKFIEDRGVVSPVSGPAACARDPAAGKTEIAGTGSPQDASVAEESVCAIVLAVCAASSCFFQVFRESTRSRCASFDCSAAPGVLSAPEGCSAGVLDARFGWTRPDGAAFKAASLCANALDEAASVTAPGPSAPFAAEAVFWGFFCIRACSALDMPGFVPVSSRSHSIPFVPRETPGQALIVACQLARKLGDADEKPASPAGLNHSAFGVLSNRPPTLWPTSACPLSPLGPPVSISPPRLPMATLILEVHAEAVPKMGSEGLEECQKWNSLSHFSRRP